jgi:ferritin-like metal-binding protein YciE
MEGGLHEAFVDELRDTYDAEKQLLKALPKLAKAASSEQLRTAFMDHAEETRGQIARLEQVFASLGEKVRGKHCDGMAGIIEEGRAVMEEDFDPATLDACLIASAQRSEHYEMAAYGTLAAWAKAMGHTEAAELLNATLEEEKATDEKLNELAEGGINQQAASAAQGDEDEDEDEGELVGAGARARSGASKSTSRTSSAGKKSGGGASSGGRSSSGGRKKTGSRR